MAYLFCDGNLTKINNGNVRCSGPVVSITEAQLVSKIVEQVPPPFPELEITEISAILAATTLFLAACFIGKQLYKMLTGTKTE